MEVIKAGGKKKPPYGRRQTDSAPPRIKQIKSKPVDEDKLPVRIDVVQKGTLYSTVPKSVFRQNSFKWSPETFVIGGGTEGELNQKFIEPSVQDSSLVEFLSKPSTPLIYCVAGNPDPLKANLFAAFLMQAHIQKYKDANPWWLHNDDVPQSNNTPPMWVVSSFTPRTTNHRLEKIRDLIERYPDVPRVIVVAGMDPMTFMMTRLYLPVNAIAYFCESIVRQKVEIE